MLKGKKRLTIFAHYDPNEKIEDYIIYYLENLKKISDMIIFVSDSNLSCDEVSKIQYITNNIIANRHGEYDFGSYKKGFLYAKERYLLDNFDELILANDSCYGPIYPFEKMFNEMDSKDVDFWGVTHNKYGITKVQGEYKEIIDEHLQSYFLVFEKQVFLSDIFRQFIENIKKEKNKFDIIINYEIGMTKFLTENGFNYDYYVKGFEDISNISISGWDFIISEGKSPFIKTSILQLKNIKIVYPFAWEKIIKKRNEILYRIIKKHLQNLKDRKIIIFKNILQILNIKRKQIIRIHFKRNKIIIKGDCHRIIKEISLGLFVKD